MESVLVGNCVEVKVENNEIHELIVRANGVCVFKLEKVSDHNYWAVALDVPNEKQLHMGFTSKSEIVSKLYSKQAEAE